MQKSFAYLFFPGRTVRSVVWISDVSYDLANNSTLDRRTASEDVPVINLVSSWYTWAAAVAFAEAIIYI